MGHTLRWVDGLSLLDLVSGAIRERYTAVQRPPEVARVVGRSGGLQARPFARAAPRAPFGEGRHLHLPARACATAGAGARRLQRIGRLGGL